jgi:hypothetical protein
MRPDMPDGFFWRTARKEHKCKGDGSTSHRHAANCPLVIRAGEDYVEYYGDTPAYQSGSRITVPCFREWWPDEARDAHI